SGKINDEPKCLQMIRSFKDKGLPGHLGGKIKQELVLQNWGPFVTEPRADRGPQAGSPLGVVDATGLWSRLTSSTMKGPVATARGSVTISCSWHGRPSPTSNCNRKDWLTLAFADNNPSRYGDPFIPSVQEHARHLDSLAEGGGSVERSPGKQESVREAQTDCRLKSLPLLQLSHQSPSLAVFDIADSPTSLAVDQHKDDIFLLPKVFETYVHARFPAGKRRFIDGELLDLKVLRIIERIAVNRPDFAFGMNRIFPNHVGQVFFKILVQQRAAA